MGAYRVDQKFVTGTGNGLARQKVSTAALVKQASEQLSRLIREELQLAKLELTEKGKRAGIGAGLLAAGALMALAGLATLITTLILLLALVMPTWLAAAIMTVVLFVIAGVLALVGRHQLRRATPIPPHDAMESVKVDVEMLRERAHR